MLRETFAPILYVMPFDTLDEAMSKEDEDRDEKLAEIDTEFLGTGERIDLKLFDYIKKNKAPCFYTGGALFFCIILFCILLIFVKSE